MPRRKGSKRVAWGGFRKPWEIDHIDDLLAKIAKERRGRGTPDQTPENEECQTICRFYQETPKHLRTDEGKCLVTGQPRKVWLGRKCDKLEVTRSGSERVG